jgi:hypothetical protein
MPQWRRSETRTVRPFPSLDSCIRNVRFKLSPDAEFEERISFDAPDVDPAELRPEFLLGVDHSAIAASAIASCSDLPLALVIRLVDLRLRRSELVFQSQLSTLPESWAVPPEVTTRFAWRFGVEASVALVLTSDRPAKVGQPFMRGHWLARKDFSIRAKPQPRAFPIERWTGEDFARMELPPDSVYWIRFVAEDLNEHFEDPGEAFAVCLRSDVYDALAYAQNSAQARALFAMIAAEILAEVVCRGLGNLEAGESIKRGSLLHLALTRIARTTGAEEEKLRRLAKEGELSALRTFAQATVGARRAVVSAWHPA